jgi:MFS superfamily sulfate permease-like transporter
MAKNQNITLKAQPAKGKGKVDKEVVLIIQGDLTLDNVSKLRDFLLENLERYERFVVKVSNAENFDLGALQVLKRFLWDAQLNKKEVEFSIKLLEEHKVLLSRAGFDSFISQTNNVHP